MVHLENLVHLSLAVLLAGITTWLLGLQHWLYRVCGWTEHLQELLRLHMSDSRWQCLSTSSPATLRSNQACVLTSEGDCRELFLLSLASSSFTREISIIAG